MHEELKAINEKCKELRIPTIEMNQCVEVCIFGDKGSKLKTMFRSWNTMNSSVKFTQMNKLSNFGVHAKSNMEAVEKMLQSQVLGIHGFTTVPHPDISPSAYLAKRYNAQSVNFANDPDFCFARVMEHVYAYIFQNKRLFYSDWISQLGQRRENLKIQELSMEDAWNESNYKLPTKVTSPIPMIAIFSVKCEEKLISLFPNDATNISEWSFSHWEEMKLKWERLSELIMDNLAITPNFDSASAFKCAALSLWTFLHDTYPLECETKFYKQQLDFIENQIAQLQPNETILNDGTVVNHEAVVLIIGGTMTGNIIAREDEITTRKNCNV